MKYTYIVHCDDNEFSNNVLCNSINISSHLAQMHNKRGSQIDITVLDFSIAFDTVPHDGILSKLKHYGIYDKIRLWIYIFLTYYSK